MRAVLYARASTVDQATGLDMQLQEMRELVSSRGWELVKEYVDEGVSGAAERRDALDRLVVAVRRGRADVVVVWKWDRLARSLGHLVRLLDEWDRLGVRHVAVRDGWDTSTPQGRLLLQVVGAFAEFERNLLRERTRAGLDAARRRGVRLGRPRHELTAEEARHLVAHYGSVRRAAAELGVSRSLIARRLREAA